MGEERKELERRENLLTEGTKREERRRKIGDFVGFDHKSPPFL